MSGLGSGIFSKETQLITSNWFIGGVPDERSEPRHFLILFYEISQGWFTRVAFYRTKWRGARTSLQDEVPCGLIYEVNQQGVVYGVGLAKRSAVRQSVWRKNRKRRRAGVVERACLEPRTKMEGCPSGLRGRSRKPMSLF